MLLRPYQILSVGGWQESTRPLPTQGPGQGAARRAPPFGSHIQAWREGSFPEMPPRSLGQGTRGCLSCCLCGYSAAAGLHGTSHRGGQGALEKGCRVLPTDLVPGNSLAGGCRPSCWRNGRLQGASL